MVMGIFDNKNNAEKVVNELQISGFNPKDISIIMKDGESTKEMGDATSAKVSTGAATGAVTGGVIGALAGLLVGVGAIVIPGIGAVLIGGPIAAALGLTGAAATAVSGTVTGILAGGVLGALVNLGVPENEAKIYEQRLNQGDVIIAVPVMEDQEQAVIDVLKNNGAEQINTVNTP
jgi:hypothetical protein